MLCSWRQCGRPVKGRGDGYISVQKKMYVESEWETILLRKKDNITPLSHVTPCVRLTPEIAGMLQVVIHHQT